MSFLPIHDEHSKILILGTYPSPKSREQGFYYGHPQNRFWKLLAAILGCEVPLSIEDKKRMLLSHHIAIWDVCDACEIEGAADATIKAVVPNDIPSLLQKTGIREVFCNGAKSHQLLCKHCKLPEGITVHKLPSTSPANAAFTFPRLIAAWESILLFL